VGVSGPFEIAEAPLSPAFVSLTTDGERFLATWISAPFTNNAWIGARLVTRDGTLAGDPSKYLLSLGGPNKSSLRALWTGTNYLVLWKEQLHLTAVRVSRDGELLDYPPLRIGTIPSAFDAMLTAPETLAVAYTRTTTPPAPLTTDLVFRYAVVPRTRITR
ncbi:MAG TPA: hypothetical protein VN181_04780, partial [Thermoanaerobaculia bacterium]|nr:hypothetical protein [Thermoanaerobaculia bacterium]